MKKYYFVFFVVFITLFTSYSSSPLYALPATSDEDMCANLNGYQTSVPYGYIRDSEGDCIYRFVCDVGKECRWVDVSNTSAWEVPPSASTQNFYNDQMTKNHLCYLAKYEYNQSDSWATKQNQWDKCNTEYHVLWNIGSWKYQKCNSVSYVSEIFCAKSSTVPTPPTPPTVTISADPSSVGFLKTTTLVWSSTSADSCVASGDWRGTKNTSGSEETSTFMFSNKTFNIACSGPGGSASDSVTVNVFVLPNSPTISWAVKSDNVSSGSTYRMEVLAEDNDGDLTRVEIKKDGAVFSTAENSSGTVSLTAGADTSDTVASGTKKVIYIATATDRAGHITKSSHEVSISAANVIVPINAPTIQWAEFPTGKVSSGSQYTIGVTARDSDNDLKSITVTKNNGAFISADGGNGISNTATKNTSDTGPTTVSFSAFATDDAGNKSTTITRTVTIGSADTAITASVSAPSCAAPGTSFTVTGNAQGSNITSNILEKDSNSDGVYGAIASRSDAGGTSASVSVPAGEISPIYTFRVNVNNGSTFSSVANVSIDSNCNRSAWCDIFPFLCNPPVTPPVVPVVVPPVVPPPSSPSVSMSSNSYCVPPNNSVTLTIFVNGAPINSVVFQKDSPAEGSAYGDGVFGGDIALAPRSGTQTVIPTVGREGFYDYKTVVNGSISSTVRIQSLMTCSPANNNVPAGGGGAGGGAGSPQPLICPSGQVPVGNSCQTPDFSISATSPVIIQAIPQVGGTSRNTTISIGPVYGYNRPINLTVIPPAITEIKKVEYSWNGAPFTDVSTFSIPVSSGAYAGTSLALRLTGNLTQPSYRFTIRGIGGDGKLNIASFNLDVRKSDIIFEEN